MRKFYEACVIIYLSLMFWAAVAFAVVPEVRLICIIIFLISGYMTNLNRKRIEKD